MWLSPRCFSIAVAAPIVKRPPCPCKRLSVRHGTKRPRPGAFGAARNLGGGVVSLASGEAVEATSSSGMLATASTLSQALGAGTPAEDDSAGQVIGEVVNNSGEVLGRLMESPGDEVGVLVDTTGSVVGDLVSTGNKEEVGALIAAKSAAMSGWASELLALVGDHPVRNSSFGAWEVSVVIGLQVLGVMAAGTGGRRLINDLVTKAEEKYEERLPDQDMDSELYVYGFLKAVDDTSSYLTIGASLIALQRTAVFAQDVFVINDAEASRVLGQTLDVALLTVLQDTAWLLEKAGALYAIALVANFALELKRELINLTLESKSPRVRLSGVDKSLPVLSSIGTWLIVGVSGIRVIVDVAGIDTQPLLALGGISGIAFGIGAQNFIRSLLAGVSLLVGVPFLVGDRVEVRAITGERVVVGVLESIRLFSTIFRTDGGAPVEVPNGQLTTLVIQNLSRTKTTRVLETFRDPRCVQLTVGIEFVMDPSLPLKLAIRIPDVVESLEKYLNRFEGVDTDMPVSCTLLQLDNRQCCTLQVIVHTLPESSGEYDEFVQGLMLGIIQVVERSNCTCTKIVPIST